MSKKKNLKTYYNYKYIYNNIQEELKNNISINKACLITGINRTTYYNACKVLKRPSKYNNSKQQGGDYYKEKNDDIINLPNNNSINIDESIDIDNEINKMNNFMNNSKKELKSLRTLLKNKYENE